MRQAADRTAEIVRQVRQEQFSLPTPCADWDVKQLIAHLEWACDLFVALADKQAMPPQTDYRGDFPERVERTLTAWSRPEAWEGVSPGLGLPQPIVATMCLGDLVTHGWDLARATGQPYDVEPEAARRVREFSEGMGPMAQEQGVYAKPIAVPQEAGEVDRMLGVSGRDPAWKP